jgi:hypothetical protein
VFRAFTSQVWLITHETQIPCGNDNKEVTSDPCGMTEKERRFPAGMTIKKNKLRGLRGVGLVGFYPVAVACFYVELGVVL